MRRARISLGVPEHVVAIAWQPIRVEQPAHECRRSGILGVGGQQALGVGDVLDADEPRLARAACQATLSWATIWTISPSSADDVVGAHLRCGVLEPADRATDARTAISDVDHDSVDGAGAGVLPVVAAVGGDEARALRILELQWTHVAGGDVHLVGDRPLDADVVLVPGDRSGTVLAGLLLHRLPQIVGIAVVVGDRGSRAGGPIGTVRRRCGRGGCGWHHDPFDGAGLGFVARPLQCRRVGVLIAIPVRPTAVGRCGRQPAPGTGVVRRHRHERCRPSRRDLQLRVASIRAVERRRRA